MITPTPKRCVWFLIIIHVLWLFGLAHQAYGQWLPRKDGIVLPQEPTIYIVHASWCAPCQRLKRDWANVPGFEQAVDEAYNIVDLDWNIPAKQRIARALGVTSLPTMVVVRNGMVMTAYQGYDGNVQKLMEGILLEWPVVKEPLVPAPRAPPVQAPSPVKPDPRIDQLMQRIEDLASRISTPPPAVVTPPKPDPPAAKPPVVFPPDPPPLANTDKSDILPPETSRGVGDKWLGVLTTIGKVGLAVVAPEVALPASAGLTAVGFVLSQLKKRRGEAAKAEFFRRNESPGRDSTEVEQILSLRQQENRDPLSDAMFGVLFEDIARQDPNQTVGQAWTAAQERFNRIAPLSSKSATITSTRNES